MTILFIEDHTDTRVVLAGLLRHCGHRIISANSLREALQLLDGMRFDILLSDLGLPDGDGLDLVGKAKVLQPHLSAIALTARASEKDRELANHAGFDHYLTKPFDFHQLRVALNRCQVEP